MATQLAYRLGRNAGRAWRGLDRRAMNALAAAGLPAGASRALLWGIKLTVLAGLLYVAFWLTLVGIGIAVAVWRLRHHESEAAEWDWGCQGFGLYYKGSRIDGWDDDEP